jgi:hypothetical protein
MDNITKNNSIIISFLNATLCDVYEISMPPLFTTNLTILNKIKNILQTNKRNNLHNKSKNQNPAT